MTEKRKLLGIIGGLGPASSAYFYELITEHTKAARDQDHIDIILSSRATTPDRTDYILGRSGESPLPAMIADAKSLETYGATAIVIPCNTAHYFHSGVQAAVDVPVLNMPEISARYCADHGFSSVALLSTAGTVRARIYEPYFEKLGIQLLHPTRVGIDNLMFLIYDEIKAGRTPHPERLYPEFMGLEEQGAQAFLLACTELPLVFQDGGRVPFIDPTLLLARAAVAAAGGKLKE